MRFLIELHVLVGQQMTSAPLVEYPESVVERQEKILDFVNDAIEAKLDYEKVCKWMKRCRIDENVHDSIFCKRKYSEAVRQNFELDLNVETRKLDKTATKSLVSLPADSRHLEALKKHFEVVKFSSKKPTLPFLPLLEGCIANHLLNSTEIQELFCGIWQRFFDWYEENREMNSQEKEFIEAFEDHITNIFREGDSDRLCDVPLIRASLPIYELIAYVNSDVYYNSEAEKIGHKKLRDRMQNVLTGNSFRAPFQKEVLIPLLEEYRKQPEFEFKLGKTEDSLCTFQMKCCGVFLSRAISDMQLYQKDKKVGEIRVFASKTIIADETWISKPGVNLVLSSPSLDIIHPKTRWDFSGSTPNNSISSNEPKNGTKPGESGADGDHGKHGESGGNVALHCDKILGAANLTIISNGGNGQNGENGGNGCDGENGKCGDSLKCKSVQDFERKFAGNIKFLEHVDAFRRKMSSTSINYDDSSTVIFTKSDRYIEGVYERKPTTLVHYRYRVNLKYRTLALVKGLGGTPGTRGGHAGSGGAKGEGSYAGKIEFFGIKEAYCQGEREVIVEANQGNDGEDGKAGNPGNGGRNGDRGADCGWTMGSNNPKSYFGSLRKYITEVDDNNRVWTNYYKKYVGITNANTEPTSYQKHGKVAKKKQNCYQRMRKKLVLHEEIRLEISKMVKTSAHANLMAAKEKQESEELKEEEHVQKTTEQTTRSQRLKSAKFGEEKRESCFIKPAFRQKTPKNPSGNWSPNEIFFVYFAFNFFWSTFQIEEFLISALSIVFWIAYAFPPDIFTAKKTLAQFMNLSMNKTQKRPGQTGFKRKIAWTLFFFHFKSLRFFEENSVSKTCTIVFFRKFIVFYA